MTARTGIDGRARGVAGVLLVALTVLGTMVVGPSFTASSAGATAVGAVVRDAAPPGAAHRELRALVGNGVRGGVRTHAAPTLDTVRRGAPRHGPAPAAGVLVAAALLLGLGAAAAAARGPAGQVPGSPWSGRRGRAPPVLAVV